MGLEKTRGNNAAGRIGVKDMENNNTKIIKRLRKIAAERRKEIFEKTKEEFKRVYGFSFAEHNKLYK